MHWQNSNKTKNSNNFVCRVSLACIGRTATIGFRQFRAKLGWIIAWPCTQQLVVLHLTE